MVGTVCNVLDVESAISGTIEVTHVQTDSGGQVIALAGTLDLTFAGGHVAGSFELGDCPQVPLVYWICR